MKKYIVFTTMVILMLGTQLIKAQTLPTVQKVENSLRKNGKYAMMVMNVQHFKAAMITGNAFYKKSPKVKFQIIACGNLVKEIAENPELKKEVAKAAQIPGHQVVICGLSIRQLNVDSAKLPKEAVITDNALLYSFGLQEMGYKMLIL